MFCKRVKRIFKRTIVNKQTGNKGKDNETMKNFALAFIKAQQEMAPLIKDTKGNFGKYSTLASVQDVCLPAWGNHGIAAFQSVFTDWEDSRVYVRISCTLIHAESGESITDELSLVPTKTDPQGIGSAITYGRRYVLMAMAGLAPEDDDGTAASGGIVQAPSKQNVQKQAPTAQTRQPAQTNGSAQAIQHRGAPDEIDKLITVWQSENDAMRWGFEQNCFEAKPHTKNAFEKLKAEHTGSVTDLYRAWVEEVQKRVKEKNQVKETV